MLDTLTAPLKRFVLEQRTRRTAREYTRIQPSEIPVSVSAGTLKVMWLLAGNEWLGSARLKGIVLDDYFQRHPDVGVFSRVAYMPSHGDFLDPSLHWTKRIWESFFARSVDVVSFQTRDGNTEAMLEDCRGRGIATVFSLSDYAPGSFSERIFQLADALVVSSETLAAELESLHKNIFIIDDAIDVPSDCRRQSSSEGQVLELIWLGHHSHWPDVAFLKSVLDCPELAGMRLRTITRHPEATHQWDPKTVWKNASRSDIAVIPCGLDKAAAAKSSNRLACFMTMGYPVVATPIPAYRKHIQHGVNGFLATTLAEWRASLKALLDRKVRERVGHAAAATPSISDLQLSSVAKKWAEVFRAAREMAANKSR